MKKVRITQGMGVKTMAACLMALGSSSAMAVVGGGKSAAAPEMVTQLIVKYKVPAPGAGKPVQLLATAEAARLSAAAGVSVVPFRVMSGDAQVVKLGARMTVAQAEAVARKMMRDPAIQYAEPDRIMRPQVVPNDPQFANQWHYHAPASAAGGANLVNAWGRTTGVVADSVVAVIDTGILPHADLAGRVLPGYDFITDPVMANDGNGRDANAADPGDWTATSNSSWHGTHVAGTIGAATDNGVGVAGVNWRARIVPVRVLGKGGGTSSDIIDGIRWAAGLPVPGAPWNANPAKVMNMSLGGGGACSYALQSAITDVLGVGASVVVAAGNSNIDAAGATPANCAGVITVASNNRAGSRAWYSNFGSMITVAAPGGDTTTPANGVLSTLDGGTTTPLNDNAYTYYQGTSMAAPHVAGIVSLMRSVRPTLNPTEIKRVLASTARAFPAGSTCTTALCGAGIVDADLAVRVAGGAAFLKRSAPTVAFGTVATGTINRRSVTLTNMGVAPQAITIIRPAGITTTGCAGTTLQPGMTCTLAVTFAPTVAGAVNGTIVVGPPSIRTANIAVSGTAVNPASEIFPPNGVMPVGWVSSAGSNAAWRVGTLLPSEGAYNLQSGVIGHLQNSSIETTKTAAAAGNVTFALKVSSEAGFDFLRFYVDGVQVGAWSGTVAWTNVSFPVTAGAHTYKWSYTKDGSVVAGSDAAWIDRVVLP